MHSETPQTLNFRLIPLLTSVQGGTRAYLSGAEASGTIINGNIFYFPLPEHIHFFPGVRNGLKMMVSGLSHLLGRVKRSDLVPNEHNTSPNDVGGLIWTKSRYYHSGDVPNTKKRHKMVVSDLTHLLRRVKRSDLVQNERKTSRDVVGGLV